MIAVRVSLGLLWLLMWCAPAKAELTLPEWRDRLENARRLVENDTPRADGEVSILEAALPDDAPPQDRVMLLNLLARLDVYLGRTDAADEHAQRALALARQAGDRIGQAEADLNLALSTVNQAQIDLMNQAIIDAMTVLDGVDNPRLLVEAMLRTSMMYRRMEQFDDSVAIAVRALDIAKRSGDSLALAYAYHAMAAAYDINHRREEALDFYRNMREQAVVGGSRRLEADALLGVGTMLGGMGQAAEGEQAIRQAIDIFRAMRMPFNIGRGLFALAENLSQRGRTADAVAILDEAEALYRQGNNKIGRWWALNARSDNYQSLGKLDLADADAEFGYRLAKDIGFPLYLSNGAKRLAAVAAARGDHSRAYRLMLEADQMDNKAAAEKSSTRMVELAKHYQNEIKQRQIDDLNRRNEKQQAEIRQRELHQRWLWTVLGGSVVMLIGLIGLIGRQRRANRLLAEANLQLKRWLGVFEHAEWGVAVVGADGQGMELMNPAFARIHGYTLAELSGAAVNEVFAPQQGDDFASRIELARRQGHHAFEAWHRRKDGSLFPVFIDVTLVRGADGEAMHFIVNLQDISERKYAEQRLTMMDFALNRVREAVYLLDFETGRFLYVNDETCRELGYGRDLLLKMTILHVDPDLDRDRVAELWLQAGSDNSMFVERRHRRRDGSVFPVELHATRFEFDGREVAIVLARNIAERKAMENALRAREQEFRTLAENIPDHIIRYDAEARKVYLNTATARLMGVDAAQLLGQAPEDTPPAMRALNIDVLSKTLRRVLDTGEPREFEVALRHAVEGMQIHNVKFVAERDQSGQIVGALMVGRDITAQKAVENVLKASERQYREIFENVSDALYLVEVLADGGFRNLAVNFAFEQSTGISREALIGHRDGEAVTRAMVDNYRRCVEAEMPIEEETVLDLPNGRRTYYSTLVPLRDDDGRIYRILGIARDVTELKRIEREFRTLAENAPDNICRYDRHCRVVYMNPQLGESLGISARTAFGKTPVEYAGNVEAVVEYQARIAAVVDDGFPGEMEITLPDIGNGPRYHHIRLVAERDASGAIVGVLAIGRDITERKLTERQIQALNVSLEHRVLERTEELRQQTRYLRTIIDSLPMLIWLKDTEGRFVLANQAAAAARGLDVERMVGKTDFDLWPPERAEIFAAEDREVMAGRQRKIVEEVLPGADADIWIEIDKVPVLDDDGSVLGTVGVVRNISERKAMEDAREQALAEAVRLARLRSDFMARMSHELRSPLNGILGYAQVMLREGQLDPRRAAMLEVIRHSGEHLLNLINDILDFAKIEAGKQRLHHDNVELPRFLRDLAAIVGVKAEQKQLAFQCDLAANLPAVIRADETRLRQVLLNLLSNAVKYSEQGRVCFRVEWGAPGRVHFEIEDSGIGIDPEHLDTIFQAFEQMADGRHSGGGTGLGLAISQELVKLMGSEIHVDSRVGEGSRFWFDLDVEVVATAGLADGTATRRLLLVSPRPELRDALAAAFDAKGLQIIAVDSDDQCLARLGDALPDLMLIDHFTPDSGGADRIRRLRGLPSLAQTPIIALSDDNADAAFVEPIAAGVLRLLPWPSEMNQLLQDIAVTLKLEPPASIGRVAPAIVAPPRDEMDVLHRLALEGSMRDIIRQATRLIELDPAYRPFAESLRSLASDYQSKAVLRWVERYLDQPSGDRT